MLKYLEKVSFVPFRNYFSTINLLVEEGIKHYDDNLCQTDLYICLLSMQWKCW
jgi:hypothetical protein